jgi:hypothetical protein
MQNVQNVQNMNLNLNFNLNLNKDKTYTIFIQIASYRDPELLPTIRDCISKAKFPDQLTFGICWQHDPSDRWDQLEEFHNDKRFRIMDVHWKESKGLGWARQRTQQLYQGETYTMQLDSHHRFIPYWDEELITMLTSLQQQGYSKPILTTYGAPYTPGEPLVDPGPYQMVGKRFSPYGTILFFPETFREQDKKSVGPIRARFVSGHFFFTLGQHCGEYLYDPEIYFAGDEISLSIRSFTLGYDLFHPHKTILWHEYTRKGRVKHWDDTPEWHILDEKSKKRLRHLLQEEDNNINLGAFCLGKIRSHSDYEKYAGICFKKRKLHPYVVDGIPPTINHDDGWEDTDLPLHHYLQKRLFF